MSRWNWSGTKGVAEMQVQVDRCLDISASNLKPVIPPWFPWSSDRQLTRDYWWTEHLTRHPDRNARYRLTRLQLLLHTIAIDGPMQGATGLFRVLRAALTGEICRPLHRLRFQNPIPSYPKLSHMSQPRAQLPNHAGARLFLNAPMDVDEIFNAWCFVAVIGHSEGLSWGGT